MALMRAAATPQAVRTIARRLRAEAVVGTIAGGLRAEAAAQRRAILRRGVLRKECDLKKTAGTSGKFKKDMPEYLLFKTWPKFLRLEMKLPKPTAAEVLANLRLMCPCGPATHEEIAAIVEQHGPFKTPDWVGPSNGNSIPSRDLSIAEVEVINKVYLDLKEELLRKREEETLVLALGDEVPQVIGDSGNGMPQGKRGSQVAEEARHALDLTRRAGSQGNVAAPSGSEASADAGV